MFSDANGYKRKTSLVSWTICVHHHAPADGKFCLPIDRCQQVHTVVGGCGEDHAGYAKYLEWLPEYI